MDTTCGTMRYICGTTQVSVEWGFMLQTEALFHLQSQHITSKWKHTSNNYARGNMNLKKYTNWVASNGDCFNKPCHNWIIFKLCYFHHVYTIRFSKIMHVSLRDVILLMQPTISLLISHAITRMCAGTVIFIIMLFRVMDQAWKHYQFIGHVRSQIQFTETVYCLSRF